MKQALDGLRCLGRHERDPGAGSETARSAFYPEQLCNAIHDGLHAHGSAHAMPATGTHVNNLKRWCQVACLSPVSACALQAIASALLVIASALIALLLVQEFETRWLSVRPRSLNLKQDLETR